MFANVYAQPENKSLEGNWCTRNGPFLTAPFPDRPKIRNPCNSLVAVFRIYGGGGVANRAAVIFRMSCFASLTKRQRTKVKGHVCLLFVLRLKVWRR